MGKRFKITHKKIWIAVGVLILLLAMAGLGLLVWWLQNKDALPTRGVGGYSQTLENKLPPVVDEAQNLALAGKTEESNKKLQAALAQPDLPAEEKQQLYIQQGVNDGNNGDYQKALAAYLEAEKAKSDFTTSHLIGEAYEALGDKDKAIAYFKKGIGQLNPGAISYTMDKTYYENKIRELGGTP